MEDLCSPGPGRARKRVGDRLAVGTEKYYRFYDTQSWEQRLHIDKYPEVGPGQVSYAADGSLMAIRHSPTQLQLVHPQSGRVLAEFPTPFQRMIIWHELSPDGRALAAYCVGGVIHIWDLQLIRRQLAERGLDW